jgi:hypothetical protein
MRVLNFIQVQIGSDATFNRKLFYIEDAGAQVTYDNMTGEVDGEIKQLAPGATITVPVGAVGGVAVPAGFYLEVSGPVDVSINGGPSVRLSPPSVGLLAKWFAEITFTAMTITNPSNATSTVSGLWAMWGDPQGS